MSDRASIIARIKKVQALTNSPVKAEADAARAKVRELLQIHGLTPGQVTQAVKPAPRVAPRSYKTASSPPSFMKGKEGAGGAHVRWSLRKDGAMSMSETEASRMAEMVDAISPRLDELRGNERSFVTEQFERWEEDGANMTLTRRQWEWLEAILERFA